MQWTLLQSSFDSWNLTKTPICYQKFNHWVSHNFVLGKSRSGAFWFASFRMRFENSPACWWHGKQNSEDLQPCGIIKQNKGSDKDVFYAAWFSLNKLTVQLFCFCIYFIRNSFNHHDINQGNWLSNATPVVNRLMDWPTGKDILHKYGLRRSHINKHMVYFH